MHVYEYITEDFVRQTKYPSVEDAYERDCFSVVRYEQGIWIEDRGLSKRTMLCVLKEIQRLYPDLIIIW